MPIVATFYHNNNETALPFVAPIPREARHYFVEPMALDCNSDVQQVRDGALLGAVTTTGSKGSICVASASITSSGGINLG